MSHATTPWKVTSKSIGNTDVGANIMVWSEDGLVAQTCTAHEGAVNSEANARFIVTACNNHDKLVEALDKILDQSLNPDIKFPKSISNIAREALALAGEK